MDNTVDFRIRLIDDLSKQMKKTRRLTESSLKSMSKEQIALNKTVAKHEDNIVKLQHSLHKASKERKKDIKEEIRLEKALLSQRKKKLSTANRNQAIKTNSTFSDRVGSAASSGILTGIGSAAVIGGGITAAIAGGVQLNTMLNESNKIAMKLKSSFGLVGDELVKTSAKIQTLSSTFGEDTTQIIQSTNALSKEMGITTAKALDLIESGFKKGANSTEEFLDIMREYPTLMNKAGIGAEEFVAITTQMVNNGMYSDKGIDAIKEGGERLLENNKATKTAIKLLPIQIQKQIKLSVAQGKTFDAMKLISNELRSMSGNDKFTVTQAIFGSAGLDAGDRIIESLSTYDSKLNDIKDTLTDFQKIDLKLSEQWNTFTESILRSDGALSSFFSNIKNGLAKSLELVNDFSNVGFNITDDMKKYGKDVYNRTITRFEKRSSRVSGSTFLNAEIESLKGRIKKAEEDKKSASESFNFSGVTKSMNIIGSLTVALDELKKFSSKYKDVPNYIAPVIKDNKSRSKFSNKSSKNIQKDLTEISASRAVKSLTINIDSLVKGGLNLETTNITESLPKLEQQFTQMLIKVVNQSGNQIFK